MSTSFDLWERCLSSVNITWSVRTLLQLCQHGLSCAYFALMEPCEHWCIYPNNTQMSLLKFSTRWRCIFYSLRNIRCPLSLRYTCQKKSPSFVLFRFAICFESWKRCFHRHTLVRVKGFRVGNIYNGFIRNFYL